jgi:hypothetical protein
MHDSIRLWLAMSTPEAQRAVELQLYETVRLWLIMLALHLPVYFLWGWVLFRHWADFWEAVVFWIKPELWSWADDEYWDDVYAEAKLTVWLLVPIGLIGLEMWLLGW